MIDHLLRWGINKMINIINYHWVWYLLGFIFAPRLTFMIWLSIYFRTILPMPLYIIGWILAIIQPITKLGDE